MTTDAVFSLLSEYGPIVVFLCAYFSCLMVPIPTSLMMLAGGAFAAVGDLDLYAVAIAALAGAVLGDQTGFVLGRFGGAKLLDRMAANPARRAVLDRARAFVTRYGGLGVYLSTWVVAPLGPWVNFVAGATGLSWLRFTIADVLGEICWVALYVGLGFAFASRVEELASLMGNIAGLLVGLLVAVGAFVWIRAVMRAREGKTAEKAVA